MPPFRGHRKPCLADVWEVLEQSGHPATQEYGETLRRAGDVPPIAVRWALELVEEISANQDSDRLRSRELLERRLNTNGLLPLHIPTEKLLELAQLGRYAEELLAERTP